MLSACYRGIAIPLYWSLHNKKGNSNGKERIELLERFVNTFGINCIECLYGDREFIGMTWISYLYNNEIPFVMRIKNNQKLNGTKASKLFENRPINQPKMHDYMCNIYSASLCAWGMRTETGDTIVVLTNIPCLAITDYAFRWEIETLFGCLKSRGFDFEATHMIEPERLNRLMCVIAIAFAWAHKCGDIEVQNKPIRIKKDGRKAHSIFQRGLESIRLSLIHRFTNPERFHNQLTILKYGFDRLNQ